MAGVNSIYTLTQDTAVNSSTCMTVSAQNITLDCAGYTITGNNVSATYGVYSDQFNTTVKNCNIYDFGRGIFIASGNYLNILNNTIGMINSGYGIWIANSNNSNVSTNNLYNRPDASSNEAIIYFTSTNSTIRKNIINFKFD